jgi:hypothetical protein
VHGLVSDSPGSTWQGPTWLQAEVAPTGFVGLARRPLAGTEGIMLDQIRMAPLPGDDAVAVVHVSDGGALLSIHDPRGVREQIVLPPLPGRIEGLVVMSPVRMALLLAEPAGVMVVDRAGSSVRHAQVGLPGLTEPSNGSLSRSLVAVDATRLLAATRTGVYALDVREDGTELSLEHDVAFDGTGLRGPIGGPL